MLRYFLERIIFKRLNSFCFGISMSFLKKIWNGIVCFDIKKTKVRVVAYFSVVAILLISGISFVVVGTENNPDNSLQTHSENYKPSVEKIQVPTQAPTPQNPDVLVSPEEETSIPEQTVQTEPENAKSKISKNFEKTTAIVGVETPDDKYVPMKIHLTPIDKTIIEKTVAAYSTDETSACIISQLIRDNWIYHDSTSASDAIMESGCDEAETEVKDYVKTAVEKIFENGEVAVRHRILFFYDPNTEVADEYENQEYVLTYGSYKFFDKSEDKKEKATESAE